MNKKPFHEMVAEHLIQQLKEETAPCQRLWEVSAFYVFIPLNPVRQA